MITMKVGRRVHRVLLSLAALGVCAVCASAVASDLAPLERAVAGDPENLAVASAYRQAAIAAADFDRPIDVLERLAKRRDSGPNIQISLALAYVDKVPTSGDIRRLYLGRDAMKALTTAIERRPSILPYYVRGLINLYYNSFIFHRIPRGIADLEKALTLETSDTPPALVARVYLSLGDGYWRLEDRSKARDVWSRGAERYPANPAFRTRLVPDARAIEDAVTTALYAGTRVDTDLRVLQR
jgi:tetratricopeptide (TPR) repeat protein